MTTNEPTNGQKNQLTEIIKESIEKTNLFQKQCRHRLPPPPASNQSWNGTTKKIFIDEPGGAQQFNVSNCDANVWICKDPSSHHQWWKR